MKESDSVSGTAYYQGCGKGDRMKKVRSGTKGDLYVGQALPKRSSLPATLKEARKHDARSIRDLKRSTSTRSK
jgi:hypothetical protein